MGTEVHCKSFLPGYSAMRDLNEDSSGSNWPLFYGNKNMRSGHYYNGFMPSFAMEAHLAYDKHVLRQKMLEHEAVFKDQVYELHRLYKIQRDMMEEIKMKDMQKQFLVIETSSPSSRLSLQVRPKKAWKWQTPDVKLENRGYSRPPTSDCEIINFSLNSTNGRGTEINQTPPVNSCSTKECEILWSRPSKIRKRLFDLHLPADEYTDTVQGRQFTGDNISEIPSISSGNHRNAPEGSLRWFLHNRDSSVKIDCQGNASASHSHLKNSIGLSYPSETVRAEGSMTPPSVNFLGCSPCHGEPRGRDLSVKMKAACLCFPKLNGLNSFGNSNRPPTDVSANNEGKDRVCFPNAHKSGNSLGNPNSLAESVQQDKLPVASYPTEAMLNNAHQSSGLLNHEDLIREGTECFKCSKVKLIADTCLQRPPSFSNSADSSYLQSASSWVKPRSSSTHELTEVDTCPLLNSTTTQSKVSQPAAREENFLGVKWETNGKSSLNPDYSGHDLLGQKDLYYGSSSRSKEPSASVQPIGFDSSNCNVYDNMTTKQSVSHGSRKFSVCSTSRDVKYAKGTNMNESSSKNAFDEAVTHCNLEIADGGGKCDDHILVLPWFRAKQSCRNEPTDIRKDSDSMERDFAQFSSTQFLFKRENATDLNTRHSQSVMTALDTSITGCKERSHSCSSQKILGVSIFENSCSLKKETSLITSHSFTADDRKHNFIDINVPWDLEILEPEKNVDLATSVVRKAEEMKVGSIRKEIDLNISVDEEDDLLAPPVENTYTNAKTTLKIDLEVPAVPESEEDVPLEKEHGQSEDHLQSEQTELPEDEFVKGAAEAILAISSSVVPSHVEEIICKKSGALLSYPLSWFVEIAASYEDELRNKCDKEPKGKDVDNLVNCSSDEIDLFEVMTLQLEETKEEEYMPKQFVPEIQKAEETGGSLFSNRGRKGHSKRGRQRRDFQRDILPGLASLSRHEVTEDIRTFRRLMGSADYNWNSGSTRQNNARNGTGRGRRRSLVYPSSPVLKTSACVPLIEQLKNMEVGLDDGSLTGWGKTTRRPRRQRFPAGNPPMILPS